MLSALMKAFKRRKKGKGKQRQKQKEKQKQKAKGKTKAESKRKNKSNIFLSFKVTRPDNVFLLRFSLPLIKSCRRNFSFFFHFLKVSHFKQGGDIEKVKFL